MDTGSLKVLLGKEVKEELISTLSKQVKEMTKNLENNEDKRSKRQQKAVREILD